MKIGDSTLMPDVDNIGFFGHSFGGSASIETCLQLPQGKGAMDIDGGLFGQSHQQPIEKPIFLMLNEDVSLFRGHGLAEAWRNISQNGYMVNIDGATHLTFTDFGILFSQALGPDYLEITKDIMNTGTIDPMKAIQITREYIVAFFDSCLKDAPAGEIDAIDYDEAALVVAGDADLYDGIWRSVGYGYLLQVENSHGKLYETTQAGMVPSLMGQDVQIHNHYLYSEKQLIARLAMSDNSLYMFGSHSGVYNYRFESAEETELPEIIAPTRDPEVNFEFFWQTFEEHCALFDLINVDWKALYGQYRPQVNANTTDEALFEILAALVTPLNDGHTGIYDPLSERVFSSGPTPSTIWLENKEQYSDAIAAYMDDGVLNSVHESIHYGMIDTSIGYLKIDSFAGYADPEASLETDKFLFTYYIDTVLKQLNGRELLSLLK